jgi:hypothetical protein
MNWIRREIRTVRALRILLPCLWKLMFVWRFSEPLNEAALVQALADHYPYECKQVQAIFGKPVFGIES